MVRIHFPLLKLTVIENFTAMARSEGSPDADGDGVGNEANMTIAKSGIEAAQVSTAGALAATEGARWRSGDGSARRVKRIDVVTPGAGHDVGIRGVGADIGNEAGTTSPPTEPAGVEALALILPERDDRLKAMLSKKSIDQTDGLPLDA